MSGSFRRCGRRASLSRDRGAVALEAAVIFPVVLLLGVGVIEWSLVLRDQIELTSLARAGARTASSLTPDSQDPYSGVVYSDQVVASMAQATATLTPGSVRSAVVFVPGSAGLSGDPTKPDFDCGSAPQCARYTWDPEAEGGAGAFVETGGTWDGSGINACLGDPDMTDVGVYLHADHPMLTGVFGSSRDLTAYTIMRIDPQRVGACLL